MYKFIRTLVRAYYKLFYKIEIVNRENLENSSGVLVAGNHISNHDPVLFYTFLDKETHFIAKEELFKVPVLKSVLKMIKAIPVKRGSFDRACINTAIADLKVGHNVGIFPEGTRSKSKDLKLGEGHKGISLISSRAEANVLPFAIIPDNNFKLFSKVKIAFGEVIDANKLREEGYKHDQLTAKIMEEIGKIIERER